MTKLRAGPSFRPIMVKALANTGLFTLSQAQDMTIEKLRKDIYRAGAGGALKAVTRRPFYMPEDWSVPPAQVVGHKLCRWGTDESEYVLLPYAKGELCYVREGLVRGDDETVRYAADPELPWPGETWGWTRNKLPGMYMPKRLARYFIYIVDVVVERLQAISEADAVLEGMYVPLEGSGWSYMETGTQWCSAKTAFSMLWEAFHGIDAWEQNPWLACYYFVRVMPGDIMTQTGWEKWRQA